MNPELFNLIRENAVGDETDYTHYTFFGPAKCWTMKSTSYSTFWLEYCKLAEKSAVGGGINGKLALGERATSSMPIICCFNFKFAYVNELSSDHYINDDFILYLINVFRILSKKIFLFMVKVLNYLVVS